jgi:hypothetical protein
MSVCSRPNEISDDELTTYAGGEPTRRVREHLRECGRCAGFVAELQRAENRLGRALFRVDCPTALELGEYRLGLLPISTQRRLEAHLANCPHCSAELATADGYLTELQPVRPVATPADQPLGQKVRRIIAELLRPARPAPAVALRGRGRSATLLYQAETVKLTLHPQPAERPRHHLQLLGFVEEAERPLDGLAGGRVRLQPTEGSANSAVIDEIGNFIIGPVPPGQYELEITLGERQIVVPELQLMMNG